MGMKIEFKTSNASFEDNGVEEVVKILESIAYKVENYGYTSGVIIDINGNKIGNWEWDLD